MGDKRWLFAEYSPDPVRQVADRERFRARDIENRRRAGRELQGRDDVVVRVALPDQIDRAHGDIDGCVV